jgi:apolipoprotein N-acyltransferase
MRHASPRRAVLEKHSAMKTMIAEESSVRTANGWERAKEAATKRIKESLWRFPADSGVGLFGFAWLASWTLAGALAFHVAYAIPELSFLVVLYLYALVQLAKAKTSRGAFYSGLALGLMAGAPRLAFFWTIFSGGAVALWLVYAFWIALFAIMARSAINRLGSVWGWIALPFLWTGLEFFRSELYYLRFAWLNPAFGFSENPWLVPLNQTGVYGVGFLLMTVATVASLPRTALVRAIALLAGTGILGGWSTVYATRNPAPIGAEIHVAGVQMEFPTEKEVILRLTQLIRRHPEAQLLVLSEYTFNEPVPVGVREWCRKNRRYLIVGGTTPTENKQFYNTAFVFGPSGEEVFQQVKGVPIQFFKDGLPATKHDVWLSPWGKIGICICYDLSYRLITDQLVSNGAEALIVPTMDVQDWGKAQHELHARIAPVRAAEYGIPIFRVASSGISQLVDCCGRVLAKAPCPGEGAELTGILRMGRTGKTPVDNWLAPLCVLATALCGCGLTGAVIREKCHPNRITTTART